MRLRELLAGMTLRRRGEPATVVEERAELPRMTVRLLGPGGLDKEFQAIVKLEDAGVVELVERAPRFTRDELIALNVNQHTGSRIIHGWFERGKYLFLLRGALGIALVTKLTERGLFLDAWNGKPAGPGLLFRIKAGERRFASVLAVDLPRLQALTGAEWPEVEEAWRGTSYPVTEVIGMGHSEPKAVALSERTELPCPRCGNGRLVRKEKDGAYFVCEDSQCGFSVDAGADGAPLPPDRCPKCGEKRYQTMAKGKKVMKHLHPCKQARAAA